MCLMVFAHQIHPVYDLILATNRDEFYARPTETAHFWTEPLNNSVILAGKDLAAGGTWLGITKKRKWAAVTNFRDPRKYSKDLKSRGALVIDFLCADQSPEEYLGSVEKDGQKYNGFNLVVGDRHSLWYYSNQEHVIRKLAPGLYGLSNHLLDTPWPKVETAKEQLKKHISGQNLKIQDLFVLLGDQIRPDPSRLPETGVSLEVERALSPIFIKTPEYGTRSSTVILASQKKVQFHEKTFGPGSQGEIAKFEFDLE